MLAYILIGLNLFCASNASAAYYMRKAEGWHWYEEKRQIKPEAKPALSPEETIQSQRKRLEKKLNQAIIKPTKENIIAYIAAQQQLMDQSQKFANTWQQVVLENPHLNETVKHPVGQSARFIYLKERQMQKEKILKNLSKEYGLFFIFSSGCEYCHAFAGTVKSFAKKYNWAVLPLSIDGKGIPEFPHPQPAGYLGESVKAVPALLAVRPSDNKIIPLAYGMVAETEIEEQIFVLTGER